MEDALANFSLDFGTQCGRPFKGNGEGAKNDALDSVTEGEYRCGNVAQWAG